MSYPERMYVYVDPGGDALARAHPEEFVALDRTVELGIYQLVGTARVQAKVEVTESQGGKEKTWTPRIP